MLKRLPKSPAAIQLTSFVDVVFNLLAFVLLVGSLETDVPERLGVEIPRAPVVSASSVDHQRKIVIRMDVAGKVWIRERNISDTELAEVLRKLHTTNISTEIWADRRIAYERVVRLLALVRENGGNHVKLMVLPDN